MLGLAEQIGGDGRGIGAGVGDDHQLGRSRGQVDPGAAGKRGDERFRRRDPGIAGAGDAVDRGDVARSEGQRRNRLRPAHGPDRFDPALLGGQRDRGVEPATAPRGRDDGQLRHSGDARGDGEHHQRREQGRLAPGDVQPRAGQRAPLLGDAQSRHGQDFDVTRARLAMEILDVAPCQRHRADRLRGERAACLGGERRDRDQFGRRAVEPQRLLDQRVPAARADVVDDIAHRAQQGGVVAPAGTLERGRVGGGKTLDHSIIFSIGITRIAEAPAALRRSSVSQNTDSWHTACTA